MIRLFKHYVPHAVLLLGLIDCGLLLLAGNFAWTLRAGQIGMDPGLISQRLDDLLAFAAVVITAMIAVGVYGADALRSMRPPPGCWWPYPSASSVWLSSTLSSGEGISGARPWPTQ